MLTNIEEPVAFDRTPLTAAVVVAVGPRTPFSPERTFVTLPRGNPEIEPLAGALEMQGATVLLKYWGDIRDCVPLSKYWGGDVSPLSHRERRPCIN